MERIRRDQVSVLARHHGTGLNASTSRRRRTLIVLATALAVVGVTLGVEAPAASAERPIELVRVSADPYTDPAGQHRTEVEPDTFAYRGEWVGAFQVGRTFSGGASNIGWVTTTNGAQRFVDGFLPGTHQGRRGDYDRVSDPSVAYDAAHRVWLISSLAHAEPLPLGAAMVVNRSPDGTHWSDPLTVADGRPSGGLDKNWTVCDNSATSPFYGHCYTVFDDNDQANLIQISTSTDGGKTWGPAKAAARGPGVHNQLIGGQPVVQPDGTVIVPIDDRPRRRSARSGRPMGAPAGAPRSASPRSLAITWRAACVARHFHRPKSIAPATSTSSGRTAASAPVARQMTWS